MRVKCPTCDGFCKVRDERIVYPVPYERANCPFVVCETCGGSGWVEQ